MTRNPSYATGNCSGSRIEIEVLRQVVAASQIDIVAAVVIGCSHIDVAVGRLERAADSVYSDIGACRCINVDVTIRR